MIIRLMYVLPMFLGRTYDVRKNTVGIDIFPLDAVNDSRINHESFYRSRFKVVESSSDVRDVLEINGDLSLGIKAGMFTFRGIGSYIKESLNIQDSVDILTKVSFRTISKSLPHSAHPVPSWFNAGAEYLGTHFVQTIFYGGDLIACVRFKASKTEYLQDIKATIKTSLEAGSALDLVGEGKLESLDKKLEKKASMEINYYATVPLEEVPHTIAGLRQLVRNFEKHVAKVNEGLGVPVEVELKELSSLKHGFDYLKNTDLDTELQFFEEYLDDLLSTKARVKSWVESLPDSLTSEQEKLISDFSERLSSILRKFFEAIADLDIEKDTSQLDGAKAAYKEGKSFALAGKFRQELNKLMKKIILSNKSSEDRGSAVYTHYGSSECINEEYTSTLYSGYLSSSPRNVTGTGYNYVCMPKVPAKNTEDGSLESKTSVIAGVKYGLLKNKPIPVNDNIVLRGIVCTVCLVKQRPNVFTFLGQNDCPEIDSWTLQYRGYIMASTSVERSENICVDSKHEAYKDGNVGYFDANLDFAVANYNEEYTFIPCAVCSK